MALLGRVLSRFGALGVLDALCRRHFARLPEVILGVGKAAIDVPTLDDDLHFHGQDVEELAFQAIVELFRLYGSQPFRGTLRSMLTDPSG